MTDKEIIKKLMKERGWTFQRLADAIGTTSPNISGYLHRGRHSMRTDITWRMLDALGYEIQIVDKYNRKAEPVILDFTGDES